MGIVIEAGVTSQSKTMSDLEEAKGKAENERMSDEQIAARLILLALIISISISF
ncbi:MAG: hypothetical protein ACRD3Z_02070 [Nitrososphaerales archaeon]